MAYKMAMPPPLVPVCVSAEEATQCHLSPSPRPSPWSRPSRSTNPSDTGTRLFSTTLHSTSSSLPHTLPHKPVSCPCADGQIQVMCLAQLLVTIRKHMSLVRFFGTSKGWLGWLERREFELTISRFRFRRFRDCWGCCSFGFCVSVSGVPMVPRLLQLCELSSDIIDGVFFFW